MYFARMESRYLLILVESLSVLSLILDEFTKAQEQQPEIIFGSRFSDDVSYTQVIHTSIQIDLKWSHLHLYKLV